MSSTNLRFASLVVSLLLLVAPRLAFAQQVPAAGNVNWNDNPVCALVLINGESEFSCDETGSYDLMVPLDEEGMITVQVFADGFKPIRELLSPEQARQYPVEMIRAQGGASFDVTINYSESSTQGWTVISGTVKSGSADVCALVLANGEKVFSCGDNQGTYSLDVPFDEQDKVTLMVFAAGFKPYKLETRPGTPSGLAYAATMGARSAIEEAEPTTGTGIASALGGATRFEESTGFSADRALERRRLALSSAAAGDCVREVEAGTCGGTQESEYCPDESTGGLQPIISGRTTLTFDNYCVFDTTRTGTAVFEYTVDFGQQTDTQITTWDYVGTDPTGAPISRDSITTCVTDISQEERNPVCTTDTTTDVNGVEYTLRISTVVGNPTAGWGVTAELIDERGNVLPIDAADLLQLCQNGNFSTGDITIKNFEGEEITINFPNCNDCVVTFRGVSEILPQ